MSSSEVVTNTVEITLNGQKVACKKGQNIIEVADEMGIAIPRFCYHKNLSVAANCRMCLIEVKGVNKPLPACATPVAAGMEIATQSAIALNAQRSVMEFLLINHPLDCPICDQGGECELQDVSIGYGLASSRFSHNKRNVYDENLGALVGTNMTRCIQCTRCVRFGEEVAGVRDLGQVGRGNSAEIGTYIEEGLKSELSANVIDLCPVGALTHKPSQFAYRSWELTQKAGIAPHDGVGSNIYQHISNKEVETLSRLVRVVPRENTAINETWLADRDRFSYCGLGSDDRVFEPHYRVGATLRTASWKFALTLACERIRTLSDDNKIDNAAFLSSNSTTIEDFMGLAKLAKELGVGTVCNNLRNPTNFALSSAVTTVMPELFTTVETAAVIVVIGADIRNQQPMFNHRIRKAQLNGARVVFLQHHITSLNYPAYQEKISALDEIGIQIKQVVSAEQKQAQAGDTLFITGEEIMHSDANIAWYDAIEKAAAELGGQTFYLTDGSNFNGQKKILNSVFSGEVQTSVTDLVAKQRDFYLIQQLEPEHDSIISHELLEQLQNAFVIVLSNYKTKQMEEYADIILPVATFAELAGSYLGFSGLVQRQRAASAVVGNSRPAWKIYSVIGKLLDLPGFDFNSHEDIYQYYCQLSEKEHKFAKVAHSASQPRLPYNLIPAWDAKQVDAVVRRSQPLHDSHPAPLSQAIVAKDIAATLGIGSGSRINLIWDKHTVSVLAQVSAEVSNNTIIVPMGVTSQPCANLQELLKIEVQAGEGA